MKREVHVNQRNRPVMSTRTDRVTKNPSTAKTVPPKPCAPGQGKKY